MKTRCARCRTLCSVEEACCPCCSAPLSAVRGVDESPRWNGKVRSQWRDDPMRENYAAWRDTLSDWLERDATQIKIIVVGFAVIGAMVTLLALLMAG